MAHRYSDSIPWQVSNGSTFCVCTYSFKRILFIIFNNQTNFLVHYSVPLSPSSLVSVIFIALLIIASIAIAVKFPFIMQHDPIHLARGLAPKYPEVGLPSPKGPKIFDPNLKAEVVFGGLRYPTSMAFLGPNDILVTEKDAGTVQRVVNGTELKQALFNVSVATYGHRGMLGIAVAPLSTIHGNRNATTYVFLYYTQAQTRTGDDITEGKQPLGNRLYRYEQVSKFKTAVRSPGNSRR